MVRDAPIAIISTDKPVIRKCVSGRGINLRGSPSFGCVKQYKLPDYMDAVFGRDNLRDNRAARWERCLWVIRLRRLVAVQLC